MASYEGVKAPLATVHCFTQGSHSFRDYELRGRVGAVTYSVIPVFLDFSRGAESPSATVTEQSKSLKKAVITHSNAYGSM